MPTFYIEQFGCRATQADGAALERQLLDRGYLPGPKELAEIIVLNTCTVTAAADAQARDAIRKISAQNRSARVVVTGCYAQRAPEELAALPGVSWVVGNSHKPELPGIIDGLVARSDHRVKRSESSGSGFVALDALQSASSAADLRRIPAQILAGDFAKAPLLSAPVFGGEGNHTRPTLKIQDGCNARCSYCVIPFVRGKSRSLAPATVVDEIRRLTAGGVKEIVLSGINLGTYGKDLNPRTAFEDLLRRILDETSVERLRVSSIEPTDVTSDLIHFFAANERMAQHFHMPLQSGSNRILAAMHRWYRAEHYARRVEWIHEQLPNAAIGADLIAGFPGETAEEHASTVLFIETLPFTYLHVFSFSKRPGTAAERVAGEVSSRIVKSRARQLRALGEKKSAAFRQMQVGRVLSVLTLRRGKDQDAVLEPGAHRHEQSSGENSRQSAGNTDYTPALSSNYLRVQVTEEFSANQWLSVRVTAADGNFLLAQPEESLPAPKAFSAGSCG